MSDISPSDRQAIGREFKSMSGYARNAANVPWWKEPTKDQWLRLLRRVAGVDARRLRLYRLPSDHGADRAGVRGSADRRDRDLLGHAGHAPGRSDGVRLVGRSAG